MIDGSFNYQNLFILPHGKKKKNFWDAYFIVKYGEILLHSDKRVAFAQKRGAKHHFFVPAAENIVENIVLISASA